MDDKATTKWALAPWDGLPSRDVLDENGERVARVPSVDAAGGISLRSECILSLPELVAAVRRLLALHDESVCVHESCTRGGAIWTICDDCGQKWADDEGGFVPYSDPPDVDEARALLRRLEGGAS